MISYTYLPRYASELRLNPSSSPHIVQIRESDTIFTQGACYKKSPELLPTV